MAIHFALNRMWQGMIRLHYVVLFFQVEKLSVSSHRPLQNNKTMFPTWACLNVAQETDPSRSGIIASMFKSYSLSSFPQMVDSWPSFAVWTSFSRFSSLLLDRFATSLILLYILCYSIWNWLARFNDISSFFRSSLQFYGKILGTFWLLIRKYNKIPEKGHVEGHSLISSEATNFFFLASNQVIFWVHTQKQCPRGKRKGTKIYSPSQPLVITVRTKKCTKWTQSNKMHFEISLTMLLLECSLYMKTQDWNVQYVKK